ncbi:MAG: hypothetical protein ACK5XV_05200 [Flavobacteriales bacterium]|jgi:hypothetical protein
MKPPKITTEQAWGFHELMVMAAFRYCLGSKTYIVGACADWLVDIWPLLSKKTRELIRRDLEEEFDRDDKARARGEYYKPLGWDCDRKDWEQVRKLWEAK